MRFVCFLFHSTVTTAIGWGGIAVVCGTHEHRCHEPCNKRRVCRVFASSPLSANVSNGTAFLLSVFRQSAFHRDNVLRGIDVLLGVDAVGTVLVTRVIGGSEFSWNRPGDFSLDSEQVLAHLQSHVTHFTPVFTPAVADNPVLASGVGIGSPAGNGNNVVALFRMTLFGKDTAGVLDNGLGVDGSGNGSPGIKLGHDLVHGGLLVVRIVIDESVLGNGGVGEVVEGHALAAHSSKGVAGLANVFRRAGGVDLGAETLGRFRRAGHVRGARVVRDVSGLLDEFVRASVLWEREKDGRGSAWMPRIALH